MVQVMPTAGRWTTRTEVVVAADTVAALIAAKLIPLTRSSLSEVSIATRVPLREIRAALERLDSGRWAAPGPNPCHEGMVRLMPEPPSKSARFNPKAQIIPDDATEWVCRKRDCHLAGKPQPIATFKRRADKGTRRTECSVCWKASQRKRYLTVEQSETLGVLLRFIVKRGDPCADQLCEVCRRPLLVGQEVETVDLLLHHAACSSGAGTRPGAARAERVHRKSEA